MTAADSLSNISTTGRACTFLNHPQGVLHRPSISEASNNLLIMENPVPIVWGSLDPPPSKEGPTTPLRQRGNLNPQSADVAAAEADLAQFSGAQSIPMPAHTISSGISSNLLPSAPASPPTPAPSPSPESVNHSWPDAEKLNEDGFSSEVRTRFAHLDATGRQKMLSELLAICDSKQLSFVLSYVSPRLRKDPFKCLPAELCLRVCNTRPAIITKGRANALIDFVVRRRASYLGPCISSVETLVLAPRR